jgi:hypothetical protein
VNQRGCSRRSRALNLLSGMHPVPARCWLASVGFSSRPFLRDAANPASGLRRSGFCLPDFGTFSSWNQTRAYRPWNAAPPRSQLLHTGNRPSAGGCTVGQPAGESTRRWGDGRGTGFPRWSSVAPRSACMQPSGNRKGRSHRSLTISVRGRISGGSVPVPWQAPATPHQQRGRSREQPSEHVAHKHRPANTVRTVGSFRHTGRPATVGGLVGLEQVSTGTLRAPQPRQP